VAKANAYPAPDGRKAILDRTRNLKMAQSAHRYVRGSTEKFYQWLDNLKIGSIPDGPPIWICGDCHVTNLGPVANAAGAIEIQIRDVDQTVIGNPAHDLLRLALSLASAARGSDLPGVTTALMLEAMMDGYERAFEPDFEEETDLPTPEAVGAAVRLSAASNWKSLARDRIDDPSPQIPLGRRFWPLADEERQAVAELFVSDDMRQLATMLKSRDDDSTIEIADAAYWMKGCSSLGRLRYAVLLAINGKKGKKKDFCLMDIKEATATVAPHAQGAEMPKDSGQRVVEGARHLSPHLGKRMRAAEFLGKSVFMRELLPQDLKLDVETLNASEAINVARYLAAVAGKAHSRQLDVATRSTWLGDLQRNRSRDLDAPTWLWRGVVDLLSIHERAYLEHCRRYALTEQERTH
jgi:uncharacterized protein (DUF2252 family)